MTEKIAHYAIQNHKKKFKGESLKRKCRQHPNQKIPSVSLFHQRKVSLREINPRLRGKFHLECWHHFWTNPLIFCAFDLRITKYSREIKKFIRKCMHFSNAHTLSAARVIIKAFFFGKEIFLSVPSGAQKVLCLAITVTDQCWPLCIYLTQEQLRRSKSVKIILKGNPLVHYAAMSKVRSY